MLKTYNTQIWLINQNRNTQRQATRRHRWANQKANQGTNKPEK